MTSPKAKPASVTIRPRLRQRVAVEIAQAMERHLRQVGEHQVRFAARRVRRRGAGVRGAAPARRRRRAIWAATATGTKQHEGRHGGGRMHS